MNWIKVDKEIFDHVGKRISEVDTAPIAGYSWSPDSYQDQIKLNLVSTHQFTCGVTELNYTVDRQ